MSTTSYDQSDPPHPRGHVEDPTPGGCPDETIDAASGDPDHASTGRFYLSTCAVIAEPSEWTDALEQLGARMFNRPETLYKALRSRSFLPESCIVDLDWIPRNLVKAVDIRVPCPKLWVGASACNPSDIKNFGVYYSRARPEELNALIARLVETDRSIMLPAGIVARQMLPFLVADDSYRERLHHYTELVARSNLITLHDDDPLELQLAAQYLAVETRRARIWEIKSETAIHQTLRKIGQARRPGTDVTIVLSQDVDTEAAREFHKSIPAEYSMIKLSARAENPVGQLSFTLPRPAERPADIEKRVVWFVCRATIDHGIALAGLAELVDSTIHLLGDNPTIEDIRSMCERSVKQHATMMEEPGEYTSYDDLVHNFERSILKQALSRHDWNLSATARSLGLAESSLRYKLNKLGVTKDGAPD